MKAAHELGGLDRLHGQRSDPREDVQLQVPHYLSGVAGRPLTVLLRLRMPGSRHQLECIERSRPVARYLLPAGISGRCRRRASRPHHGPSYASRPRTRLDRSQSSAWPACSGRSRPCRWSAAEVQALPVGKHLFLLARLRRFELKFIELSHGVPAERLKLKICLGYT